MQSYAWRGSYIKSGKISHKLCGMRVPEVLEPRPEYPGLCVDVGNAEHEHSAPQVMVKVHALAHFTARHRQQHCAPPILTSLGIKK